MSLHKFLTLSGLSYFKDKIISIIEDNESNTAAAITDLNERVTNLELNEGGFSNANVQAVVRESYQEPEVRPMRDAVDLTTGEKIYFAGDASYICVGNEGSMLLDYIDDKVNGIRIIKWDIEAGPVDYIPDPVLNWVFTQEGIFVLNGGIAIHVTNEEDPSLIYIQSAIVKDDSIVATKVFLTALGHDSDLVTIDSYPISGGSGDSTDTSDCVKTLIVGWNDFTLTPDADGVIDLSDNYICNSITIDGQYEDKYKYYPAHKGTIDLGYIRKQLSTSTSSSMTLSPNIYYRNTNTSLSTLTITFASETSALYNSLILNEYFVEFTTSNSGTTVYLPSTIKWANGETPTFEASTTYQISIVNNLGVVTKFK